MEFIDVGNVETVKRIQTKEKGGSDLQDTLDLSVDQVETYGSFTSFYKLFTISFIKESPLLQKESQFLNFYEKFKTKRRINEREKFLFDKYVGNY